MTSGHSSLRFAPFACYSQESLFSVPSGTIPTTFNRNDEDIPCTSSYMYMNVKYECTFRNYFPFKVIKVWSIFAKTLKTVKNSVRDKKKIEATKQKDKLTMTVNSFLFDGEVKRNSLRVGWVVW